MGRSLRYGIKIADIIIIASIILPHFLWADELEISVSVDDNSIRINQQIELVIEFKNADDFPRFKLDLDDFALISGPARSSNFQWINGKSYSSKKVIYTIAPLETGNLQIGPFKISYDGKAYTTNAVTVKVSDASSVTSKRTPGTNHGSAATQNTENAIFIRAEPEKTTLYKGEQLTVTYRLYTRVSIRNYSIEKNPNAVGFWKEEIETPKNPRLEEEVVNGIRYSTAVIKKIAYFPTKSGDLRIHPLSAIVEIQSSRRRSVFDDFFSDPFSRGVTKRLTGNAINIKVLPVPEADQPENFTGAVGTFQVSTSLDTQVVKIDEAVGLNVSVTGTGNIPMITMPPIEPPPGVDMFDPEVKKSSQVRDGLLQGRVDYQYIFIPRREGTIDLPRLSFSYFNPATKSFTTLETEGGSIRVLPLDQPRQIAGSGFSREEVKLLNMDIRYLKPDPGLLSAVGQRYYTNWLFYLGIVAGFVIMGGSVGYRYWNRRWGNDDEYLRRKRAMKRARRHLSVAKADVESAVYVGELSKAVLGFIGDKMNIAENTLKIEDVKSVLSYQAVPDETIERTETFLIRCDAGRFAPEEQGGDGLHQEAETLIKELNKYL